MNAGKRHVCADIRTAEGAELVARMAEQSDVLIENFRPAVLTGRGLGYVELAARNPRLVYLSISGFGQTGTWSDRRAHAPLLHAEGGTIEVAARLRGQPPVPEVHQHADLYSGHFGVSAVCAALYQRERTGAGQHLDVALAEVLLYASDQVVMDLLEYDGPREFDTWTYPVVTLASGETVCLVGNPLRLYGRWMAALGAEPGVPPADEHTASAKVKEAVRRFADATALRAALAADGLVCTVVQRSTTLLASEWAEERQVLGVAAPGVRAPAAPWRSSAAEIRIAGPAKGIGADSRDVLRDLLHLNEPEIDALAASGVIRADGVCGSPSDGAPRCRTTRVVRSVTARVQPFAGPRQVDDGDDRSDESEKKPARDQADNPKDLPPGRKCTGRPPGQVDDRPYDQHE
jgi:crotonobetainyl-CoA:carnitine CoA-transferase CaiB-like acyl-CoA transferase